MFVRGLDGQIVNLSQVGEVGLWVNYDGGYLVRAFTGGGGNIDNAAVWVALYKGNKTDCHRYLAALWNKLCDKGLAITVDDE